ncbi:MAG: hypothetical protein GEU88_08285 [Solirubrobacterales bacterium]|nr:hypothetical protein [Solirubrobacterales bacterium]
METVVLALVALACPVGMGLMMWMMARGMRAGDKQETADIDLEQLRAEQQRLSAEVARLEDERKVGAT